MKFVMMIGVVLFTTGIAGQDAATILPKHYAVQFENEWVRVTSVRYGPNDKLPEHTHTALPSAYVYLSDSGPVIFRHVGGPSVTRQPVKAGTFRVFRGIKETHEVENTAAFASEFLRVELKTEARDAATIRGKFERPARAALQPVVQFDHPQFRISRLWVQPGQSADVTTETQPALVIALAPNGSAKAGTELWIAAGQSARLTNRGAAAIDFLRVDLKTSPAR